MPTADEKLLGTVRAWIGSAQDDRATMDVLARGGGPLRPRAFHAQQAVEKLLKALLVSHGVDPDDSHDVGRLARQLHRLDRKVASALGAVDRLTQYAVEMRYPPRPGRASRSFDPPQVEADIAVAEAACGTLDAALAPRLATLAARLTSRG